MPLFFRGWSALLLYITAGMAEQLYDVFQVYAIDACCGKAVGVIMLETICELHEACFTEIKKQLGST